MQTFKNLNIKQTIKDVILENGLEDLTDIQSLAIPLLLEGKDIIAQAQTGTGKTFAFAIPIIENLKLNNGTEALVLCPTRELALQVYNEFVKLLKYEKKITVVPIVGGESYTRQFKNLKRNPEIIIGTPGRIIDHLERKTLDFSNITSLTFDEADEMLKMGFKDDIETILKQMKGDVQTSLFSATIPNDIKMIAKKYQKDAVIVSAKTESLTVSKITQNYYVVKKTDKLKLLTRILDIDNVNSAIVFANTKKEVDEITVYLNERNYQASSLHGDLKQNERNHVTNNFRNNQLKILVATDVAARGLDIKGVEVVINYDLPYEMEVYVHRIGRTGRAGMSGQAYSIMTPRTENKIKMLSDFIKQDIKFLQIPEEKAIGKRLVNNFIETYTVKANNFAEEYGKIISQFEEKGISKDKLLNLLISEHLPENKVYEAIEMVNVKKDKPKREKTNKRKIDQSDFITFKINLGKNDKVTPIALLDLLGARFNIRGSNIGDIKLYKNFSTIKISGKSVSNIKQDKFKYQGKQVRISVDV